MFSYFSTGQLLPFIFSSFLLAIAVLAFLSGYKKTALLFLFSGAFGLGIFIANLDHFLILWDEQYHAMVAKNMLDNPFKPMLYSNPIMGYDYRQWTANHIWLHKQPLFLWQIMISLKMFGISALAVRLPSVIMHALMIFFIYRMGKIINHPDVGFFGALFFAVAYYPLELLAGRYSTDHNDVAFLFYFTASFWSWFEYQQSKKKYWLLVIGIFCGCAVLVKWLMGLLIYPVWSLVILYLQNNKGNIAHHTFSASLTNTFKDNRRISNKRSFLANLITSKNFTDLLWSLLVSFLVFIPWQIYSWYAFPQEASFEFSLNGKHLFEAVEGHSGNVWFHLEAIKELYGAGFLIPILLFSGLIFLIKNAKENNFRIVIISVIILVYGFYSFAATKMVSYCLVVSPFIFLGTGALTFEIFGLLQNKIRNKTFHIMFKPVAIIAVCFLFLNMSRIQKNHTMWKPHDNGNREAELKLMVLIERLPAILKNDNYVIFTSNIRLGDNIPIMFYTGYTAYNFLPTKEQIEKLKLKSYKIAIVNDGHLPDYILADNSILKILL